MEQIVKMEDLDASLVSSGKSEAEAALARATDEVGLPSACRHPCPARHAAASRPARCAFFGVSGLASCAVLCASAWLGRSSQR